MKVRFLLAFIFIWENKLDVAVAFIATLVFALYTFDVGIIISMFFVFLIYALIRFESTPDEKAGALVMVWFVIMILSTLTILKYSEKTTNSIKNVEYKDIKFTKQKYSMVINYSNPEKLKVINLSELQWFQLQEKDCIPVRETVEYTYWTDIKGSMSTIKCKGK